MEGRAAGTCCGRGRSPTGRAASRRATSLAARDDQTVSTPRRACCPRPGSSGIASLSTTSAVDGWPIRRSSSSSASNTASSPARCRYRSWTSRTDGRCSVRRATGRAWPLRPIRQRAMKRVAKPRAWDDLDSEADLGGAMVARHRRWPSPRGRFRCVVATHARDCHPPVGPDSLRWPPPRRDRGLCANPPGGHPARPGRSGTGRGVAGDRPRRARATRSRSFPSPQSATTESHATCTRPLVAGGRPRRPRRDRRPTAKIASRRGAPFDSRGPWRAVRPDVVHLHTEIPEFAWALASVAVAPCPDAFRSSARSTTPSCGVAGPGWVASPSGDSARRPCAAVSAAARGARSGRGWPRAGRPTGEAVVIYNGDRLAGLRRWPRRAARPPPPLLRRAVRAPEGHGRPPRGVGAS